MRGFVPRFGRVITLRRRRGILWSGLEDSSLIKIRLKFFGLEIEELTFKEGTVIADLVELGLEDVFDVGGMEGLADGLTKGLPELVVSIVVAIVEDLRVVFVVFEKVFEENERPLVVARRVTTHREFGHQVEELVDVYIEELGERKRNSHQSPAEEFADLDGSRGEVEETQVFVVADRRVEPIAGHLEEVVELLNVALHICAHFIVVELQYSLGYFSAVGHLLRALGDLDGLLGDLMHLHQQLVELQVYALESSHLRINIQFLSTFDVQIENPRLIHLGAARLGDCGQHDQTLGPGGAMAMQAVRAKKVFVALKGNHLNRRGGVVGVFGGGGVSRGALLRVRLGFRVGWRVRRWCGALAVYHHGEEERKSKYFVQKFHRYF